MKADKIEVPPEGLLIHRIPAGRRIILTVEQKSGFSTDAIDVIPRLVNGEQNTDGGRPGWISLGHTCLWKGTRKNGWRGSIGENTLITTNTMGDAPATKRRFNR